MSSTKGKGIRRNGKNAGANLEYALIQGAYWMYYGAIYSFSSAFLLSKDYSNWDIGVILAAGNVLAILIQPAVANFADRTGRFGLDDIIKGMVLILAALTAGLILFDTKSMVLTVIFTLAIAWHTVIHPFVNSLAFEMEKAGRTMYFSAGRAVGSVSYSILVAVLGVGVSRMGVGILPFSGLGVLALFFFMLVVVGRQLGKEGDSVKTEKSDITFMDFVRRNKVFFAMSLGIAGLYFSNSVYNNFMLQIVRNVGGDSGDMGGILSLMAALEIPTMVLFYRINKRISTVRLIQIAALGFALKATAIMMADSVSMLYCAHIFQLISFALFLPAIVHYIDERMSGEEAVRGQAVYTTMITVGAVLASVAGGAILDMSGVDTLLTISVAVTLAGALTVIPLAGKSGPG